MGLEDKRAFVVNGEFGFYGGSTNSGKELVESLAAERSFAETMYKSGGSNQGMEKLFEDMKGYNVVFWFADKKNLNDVKQVKRQNGESILVSLMQNDGQYSTADVLTHALDTRSNLLVEMDKEKRIRVIDPLANVFVNFTKDYKSAMDVVKKRVNDLMQYGREKSVQVGDAEDVPNCEDFFSIVRNHGTRFHELIHANPENTNRFFGNASFRCLKGFPSFRENWRIYVSRRNLDKRDLNREGFVALDSKLPLQYYGKQKPSVDSPVQVRLYNYYENVKFMLHGHVYVKDARFTDKIMPCGALEEADEIISLYPDKKSVNFAVNLKGHGSIVLADSLEALKNVTYVERKMPEIQEGYYGGRK
jgi:ribulose-5-phosphate 4-epimerase/fuculose-1-phosphate aldolase